MKADNKVKMVHGELELEKQYIFLGNETKKVDSFKFTVLKKTPQHYTILVEGLKRFNLKNDTELFTNIQNRLIYEIQE